MSEQPAEHAGNRIPILSGSDGQAYIPAAAVIQLLRAISASCDNLADDPDCTLRGAAAAINIEADTIECRAILRTR